jgi:crossover junction endodeoxyribonuclease RuvC
MIKITGLDLSLTSSGVAKLWVAKGKQPVTELETVESKPPPVRYDEKGKPKPATLGQRRYRLDGLRRELLDFCQGSEVVAVEGPAYASVGGHPHDRSGLWWLVVEDLLKGGYTVVEIPPNNVKMYATGKGNSAKEKVMLAAANRYRDLVEVTGNDVADALVIAAMTAREMGYPVEPSLKMPDTHLRALTTVAWPEGMYY